MPGNIQLDPHIYDGILASLDPKMNEADIATIEAEHAEQLKDALLADLEHGFGLWGKEGPASRYQTYLEVTFPADLYLALDPNFREDRRKGKREEVLQAEQLLMQRMAYERQSQQLVTQGIPAPPLPDEPKLFWAQIAMLPDYIWAYVSRDFRQLHRKELRLQEFEVSEEISGGLPWT